jgi:osmotically-inducible protein OsmY
VAILRIALWLVFGFGLAAEMSGCPLAIVGGLGAAGGAGYAANQERGAGGVASDFKIKTNIQNTWMKADLKLSPTIDINVYEGRVLLTGTTASSERKAEAAELARTVPGVKAVYNEIELAPNESVWDSTKDAWITSRVKSGLLFSNVRSVNYTIETANRSVYLIGSARSQAELDHATGIARNVPGVKRVVSYVEVRPGAPQSAQATAASGALPAANPPSGAPYPQLDAPAADMAPQTPPAEAPTAPVEVHRL